MDKNKIIESAAKLVGKGAYDKAIKEYQKVLDADPRDVRILQKMGELYQKKNDNAQAATYFTKVAESYSSEGFFLKAVALYKQVLKLNPDLVEVNLKLAELHQQLQLMSEAMAYYQLVANYYDKAGNTKASLDTLRKMVDLDPENVASKVKLAELYAREDMQNEALVEFRRAADYLKKNNRTDDYLRVAERISALEPNNLKLARELAESYLSKGDQKRALAKLQVCFKADPRDVETLKLLASAFQGLGQTSKTLSVYKELIKVYTDRNQAPEANQVWSRIEALDPNDPDLLAHRGRNAPQRVATPVAARPTAPPPSPTPNPAPPSPTPAPASAPSVVTAAQTRSPAPVAAPSPGVAAPRAQAPAAPSVPREQLQKLLTETDVYVKYGLHDKALEHLRKIFAVDPENLDAHEKAYHIYLNSAGNQAQAAEQLLNVLRLMTRRGESQRAQPYLRAILEQNPNHPEVPAFMAVLGGAATAGDDAEEAILVDSNDEEVIVSEAPPDALANEDVALVTVTASGGEEVLETGEAVPDVPDVEDEPLVVATGDDEPLGDEVEVVAETSTDEEVVEEPVVDDPAFGALGSEDELVQEEPAEVVALEVEADAPTGSLPALQGDVADDELTFQQPEEAAELTVETTVPADEPDMGFEYSATDHEAEVVAAPVEEPVEAPPDEEPASEECDEAAFFLDQSLFDEAREILETVLIAYPGHRRATAMLAELEAAQANAAPAAEAPEDAAPVAPPPVDRVEPERDAFDLAQELADELGGLTEAEASAPPESAAGDDFQYSVEEVFSEFKKGLAKVVKPEDVDTHYDLGIAYKEMGLVDDAIHEFTVAREGCAGKKKEIDCLTMMGLLQLSKGDHAAAIDAFRSALGSEHSTGETEKALRYELGTAYEASGAHGKALHHLLKVHSLDAKYRDVAAAVARLEAVASPEDDPLPHGVNGSGKGMNGVKGEAKGAAKPAEGPAGKARKVGYV